LQTKIYIDRDIELQLDITSLKKPHRSIEIIEHKYMSSSLFLGTEDITFFFTPLKKIKNLINLFHKNNSWIFGLGEEEDLALSEIIYADNIIELDIHSPDVMYNLIDLCCDRYLLLKRKKIFAIAEVNLRSIVQGAEDFIQFQLALKENQEYLQKKEFKEVLNLYLELLQLNDNVLFIDSEEELYFVINQAIKKHQIIECIEKVSLLDLNGNSLLIPLLEKEQFLQFLPKESIELPKTSFYLAFIIQMIERFYNRENSFLTHDDKISFWEEAFAKIPLPIVLFNEKGDLVLHNPLFSKLKILPKKLVHMLAEDSIEIEGEVYKVIKKNIIITEKKYFYCVFNPLKHSDISQDEKNNTADSSQELGIVSSSIAHELNNPIAGILAALSVIELEDDLDDDMLEGLVDMRKGAKRCKELVQVFLGFSKTAPMLDSEKSFSQAFKQGKDLLRFRMMEADLRFELRESLAPNNKKFNVSVVSMIFYLILNEVITAYSHHRIIINKEMSKVLSGSFCENEFALVFSLDIPIELFSNIKKSKLIKHLVQLENLKLHSDMNKLTLSML